MHVSYLWKKLDDMLLSCTVDALSIASTRHFSAWDPIVKNGGGKIFLNLFLAVISKGYQTTQPELIGSYQSSSRMLVHYESLLFCHLR